jgi:hypothetical protein
MKLDEKFQESANKLKTVLKFSNVFSEDYYRFKILGKEVNGQRFPDLSDIEVSKIKIDIDRLKKTINGFEKHFK